MNMLLLDGHADGDSLQVTNLDWTLSSDTLCHCIYVRKDAFGLHMC